LFKIFIICRIQWDIINLHKSSSKASIILVRF